MADKAGFQPSGMRTFQILRFAKKVVNPCNSPAKQGKKKAEWRVTIRRIDKKMVDHTYANQNLFSIFCNSLIIKHSHRDTKKNRIPINGYDLHKNPCHL